MDLRKLIGIVLVVFVGLLGYFFFKEKTISPVPEREAAVEHSALKVIDFSAINSVFRFSAEIPAEFEVEYIPELEAISISDLSLPGESVREKSQIYISSFEADRFLTLSTVNITQRDEILVKGHDAVLYEITKKPEVQDFPQQPSWRNFKHKAIDIRFTKDSPGVFYSFAYNPALSENIFNDFIDSLVFYNNIEPH